MGRKKLIVVGLDIYFADSLQWFQENGFTVTVLTWTGRRHGFANNAALYADMGFRVVTYDHEAFRAGGLNFDDLALDPETLILAGPNFTGDVGSLAEELDDSPLYDLWLLQSLAGYNRRRGCGAMVVRFHNGDTGFGSREMADLYALGLADADLLLFDNDLLREFVWHNVPVLRAKKSCLLWLEGPLKRHLQRNEGRGPDFICLGRFFCDRRLNIPVVHLPTDQSRRYEGLKHPVKPRYNLAKATSLVRLAEDRAAFAEDLRGVVFGLDHFGGVFTGGRQLFERHKEFFFSPDGQSLTQVGIPKEVYYGFCNCPSKIAAYLMYGIIPVLSHTLHNVYRELAEKKMAVSVERAEDLERLRAMSDGEIQMYRENIQAHADIFTFDSKAEFLTEEFAKFRAGADPRPGRQLSEAATGDRAFDELIRKSLARHQARQVSRATSTPRSERPHWFLSTPKGLAVHPWLEKRWVKLLRRVFPTLVDAWLIADAGVFDPVYYFLNNPGLLRKRRNPILGYVQKGAREGRNPNAWFDTKKYLADHPEAAKSGLNPLVHYLYVHRDRSKSAERA
jgi:hypothetical protein